jgi:5,10-methenyltetrahydrofolate synthetase
MVEQKKEEILLPEEVIVNEKKLLRKKIADLKKEITLAEMMRISEETLAKVEAEPYFRYANTILMYYSLPDELQTRDFINRWYKQGKRIVLPVVVGEDLLLKEYNPEYISVGYKGIKEPTAGAKTVSPSEIDLAIIPGVAFDYKGNRMGRGKGFYDRFLPLLHCEVWGLALPFQMTDNIPCEKFDKPVDKVFFVIE